MKKDISERERWIEMSQKHGKTTGEYTYLNGRLWLTSGLSKQQREQLRANQADHSPAPTPTNEKRADSPKKVYRRMDGFIY